MAPHRIKNGYDFQTFVPYRVTRLNSRLNKQAHALLEKFGDVTLAQWRLILLLKHEGIDTLSEASEISGIDKGMLSRNLSSLVEEGLVEMNRSETDMRVKKLALTEKGEALHARLQPIMTWRQDKLLGALTDEEAALFQSMFDRLEAAADDVSFEP